MKKEFSLDGRVFILNNLDLFESVDLWPQCREALLLSQYPERIGVYLRVVDVMLAKVAVLDKGVEILLSNEELINNYVKDGGALLKLGNAIIKHNIDCFDLENITDSDRENSKGFLVEAGYIKNAVTAPGKFFNSKDYDEAVDNIKAFDQALKNSTILNLFEKPFRAFVSSGFTSLFEIFLWSLLVEKAIDIVRSRKDEIKDLPPNTVAVAAAVGGMAYEKKKKKEEQSQKGRERNRIRFKHTDELREKIWHIWESSTYDNPSHCAFNCAYDECPNTGCKIKNLKMEELKKFPSYGHCEDQNCTRIWAGLGCVQADGLRALMSVELTLLAWSPLLFAAYIGVQSILYRMQHGVVFAATGRDNEAPPSKYSARAERALRNLLETYAVFVALAVATELSGRSDSWTQWGAHIWFWSRWVYLPLYVFGVPFVRSLVWLVSAIALAAMWFGLIF